MADVVEFHERREDEERLHRRLEIQDYMLMKSSSVGVRVGTRQSRRGHGAGGENMHWLETYESGEEAGLGEV